MSCDSEDLVCKYLLNYVWKTDLAVILDLIKDWRCFYGR